MKSASYTPENLARFMAAGLLDGLKHAPYVSLAVSGGRTPEAVFPLLAQADLAWERVWITLTDERWLPPDHEGSNEGLARRLLLQGKAGRARFVGFWSEASSPESALPGLEYRLSQMPWPLDMVFLGMGTDGHVASLFPNDGALEVETGRVTTARGPAPYTERASLVLPELVRAKRVALLANGLEKQTVLQRGSKALPVHRFLALSNESVTVFG
ncbi:MAG: 6-phosphogluconolactonase [Alphaproteobacteria bacterium]|nr:6-phosphogluconolactonase [Alphaproteobacteria bacterium]